LPTSKRPRLPEAHARRHADASLLQKLESGRIGVIGPLRSIREDVEGALGHDRDAAADLAHQLDHELPALVADPAHARDRFVALLRERRDPRALDERVGADEEVLLRRITVWR